MIFLPIGIITDSTMKIAIALLVVFLASSAFLEAEGGKACFNMGKLMSLKKMVDKDGTGDKEKVKQGFLGCVQDQGKKPHIEKACNKCLEVKTDTVEIVCCIFTDIEGPCPELKKFKPMLKCK